MKVNIIKDGLKRETPEMEAVAARWPDGATELT